MVLLYFMDGLKFKMLKEHMPFLASLNCVPLKSDFGYSCACHATMYTSRYIEEHNTWFVWKKGDNSPYKFVDKVPFLKHLNCIPVKFVVSKLARKLTKSRSFSGIPMLVNLPLKYWSMFEPCERTFWTDEDYLGKTDTLFKILNRECVPNYIVGLSRGEDVFANERCVDYKAAEFVYYFIGDVDSYMHKYGEKSTESINYLKRVDEFIKSTFEHALSERGTDDITMICYSDHGHIDVDKKIDINDYFKPHGFKVNSYIHLIESTFARFWLRNESDRTQIMSVLDDMHNQGLGFVLDEAYFDTYHLHFNSNEHGDIIFHLNAPNIFTNTIWGYGKTIRSMHGYEPTLEAHYGVFASNRDVNIEYGNFAHLTDILPTILTSLGIDTSKMLMRGTNILERKGDDS